MISIKKLIRILKEYYPKIEIRTKETFKKHTTFKVGGKIGAFIEIHDIKTLFNVLEFIKKYNIRYFILGAGSNLLASDKRFNGVVIKVALNDYLIKEDRIICGAGLSLFRLSSIAIENCLSGLEWSYGIPGSVGGGIKMNAGCYGEEIGNFVEFVYYTDGNKIYKKTKTELDFSYRHSYFTDKNLVILKVCFKLSKGSKEDIRTKCYEIYKKRKQSQPYDLPSAGSIFKRPKDGFAPVYIEKCNLKGFRYGGAEISSKHCGFIVNYNGKATFKQIFKLICKIKKTVLKKFGIILEEEIIILR